MGPSGHMLAWVFIIVANVALVSCAFALRQRLHSRRLLGRLALGCGVVFLASTVFGIGFGLRAAFNGVGGESIDPSQKARILAEGISEAMNYTALSVLSFVPPLLVAIFLFRRAPKEPPPKAPGYAPTWIDHASRHSASPADLHSFGERVAFGSFTPPRR